MEREQGFLSLHSEDISYYDLQNALSNSNNEIVFNFCDNEAKRDLFDAEWVNFVLMALPAAESTFNIIQIIKDEVKIRVLNKMNELGIRKSIKISLKIKLPFFLYEKTEEIIVNPNTNN